MPDSLATSQETINRIIRQRQLSEFAASKFNAGLDIPPSVDPETAVEWVATADFSFAGVASAGVIRFTRGQHITYPALIRQLRDAGAAIAPVR